MKHRKKNYSTVRRLGGKDSVVFVPQMDGKKVRSEITRMGPYPNVTVNIDGTSVEVDPHNLTFEDAPTSM